jgi:hypothetical protein
MVNTFPIIKILAFLKIEIVNSNARVKENICIPVATARLYQYLRERTRSNLIRTK